MTALIASFFGCILAAQPADAHLTNGIYYVLWSGNGTTVERADGSGTVVLGERASTAFGKASLKSVCNDNSRYRLDLTGAGPFPANAEKHHFAIYLDGVCALASSGSAPPPDRTMNLGIQSISGASAAEKVGKALGVEPILRHHPGHQLLVAWHAVKASYAPRQPVVLRMEIKNVGKVTVHFWDGGQQRGPRDNQFGFTAYRDYGLGRAMPDTGSPENFGGRMSLRTLRPGDTFTKEVDITDWFKFEDQGSYRITCWYRLELLQSKGEYAVADKPPLWDEFAIGDCAVRIEGPAEPPKP
jgi:hypothetical protein